MDGSDRFIEPKTAGVVGCFNCDWSTGRPSTI